MSSYTPSGDERSLERIYILPARTSTSKGHGVSDLELADAPVYAPVSLTQISPQVAEELLANATEAWVSRFRSTQPPVRPRGLSSAHRPAIYPAPDEIETPDLISLENEKA